MYKSFAHAAKQLAHIEAVDFYLAKEMLPLFANEITNGDDSELFHCIVATSEALRQGHSCIPLSMLAGTTQWQDAQDNQLSEYKGFQFGADLVANISRYDLAESAGLPLISEQGRLYLRRYWRFENELADALRLRMHSKQSIQHHAIGNVLNTLFPTPNSDEVDWQHLAVANALNKSLSIIAGGPGTGKTYTVTKLLAALISVSPITPKIAMVAPTGKAAQRLSESIINAVSRFREQGAISADILDKLPTDASTIHRLLGVIPNDPNFRHQKNNPLDIDMLLIDEVSMVDLPMMTRIFRALPEHCRVVMLGDADQLPSVAAGSVLADLAPRPHPGYSQENIDYLAAYLPWSHPVTNNIGSDHLTFLMKSRRFDGSGGIGQLAKQVIEGEAQSSWQWLHQQNADSQVALANEEFETWLQKTVKQHYFAIFEAQTIEQAFAALDGFRVLVASRKGDLGVDAINERIELILAQHNHIPAKQSLYKGRPIMINQNHYGVKLFNGDIGLLWPNESGQLMAVFPALEGGYRWLVPSRLPAFDTVYAMTIHKTQGSEFAQVAMILSEFTEQLLSRELIYTAITRAKQHITVRTSESVWLAGVSKKIARYSGLKQRVGIPD